ncbi:MAG: crossover junction endodeoxyribonuclease RuvC [Myxococcaceae bacterium]|nr:crossover junction endodeoxyribonuclease RuvC [Myxococcaceae bacterium]
MRVLGIDPGSRFLGWGLVESRGSVVTHLDHGVIKADPDAPLAARLHELFDGLKHAIGITRPDSVAVEGVFTHKNARSALILGHARGVALLLAAQMRLEVFEYPPARVKRSVGAGGNDGKDAVARMVSLHLKLKAPLERADAYDALAVALCHVHASKGPKPTGSRASALSKFEGRLAPSIVRA